MSVTNLNVMTPVSSPADAHHNTPAVPSAARPHASAAINMTDRLMNILHSIANAIQLGPTGEIRTTRSSAEGRLGLA
jgi:hypothetical protein